MKLDFIKVSLPLSAVPAALADSLFNGKGAVFEDVLRRLCCAQTACTPESCSNSGSCPVPALLAKISTHDPYLLKKHQKPGLPFVFRRDEQQDALSFVLLGSAMAHLSLFLDALFPQAGGQAAYPVVACDGQNSPVPITFDSDGNAENLPLLEAGELLDLYSAEFQTCTILRLDLGTPLRMVRNGYELSRFDPVFFIRSLLRRLSSLAAHYGEGADTDYFRHLAILAGDVRLLRPKFVRGATAQGRGLSGSCELCGPFAELGPLLRLGEFVHLGKGASYGQGAFSVVPIS